MTCAEMIIKWLLEDGKGSEIRLMPPTRWESFVITGEHGMLEFMKHVKEDDIDTFVSLMRDLAAYMRKNVIMVPTGRWTLKMRDGYGIYGTAHQGISVLSKSEDVVISSQVIDNPVMSIQENLRWRKGL